jgi:hypothetical protein
MVCRRAKMNGDAKERIFQIYIYASQFLDPFSYILEFDGGSRLN